MTVDSGGVDSGGPPAKAADASCLFCRIVAGEIESRPVYADEHAYAFLDIQPWHRGHTLVVPRRHVADLLSGDRVLAEIAPAIEKVSRRLVERLGADGLTLVSSSGAVAGQEVFHLHVHLVPRYAAAPGTDGLIGTAPGAAGLIGTAPADEATLDEVHARLTRS